MANADLNGVPKPRTHKREVVSMCVGISSPRLALKGGIHEDKNWTAEFTESLRSRLAASEIVMMVCGILCPKRVRSHKESTSSVNPTGSNPVSAMLMQITKSKSLSSL